MRYVEVEKKFPNIRSKIAAVYTSTPLTYRDYIGNGDGSLYGIVKDHNNPLKTFISAKTAIPNLFLTGQNLNKHGILGVTISAVSTCQVMLGKDYVVDQILEREATMTRENQPPSPHVWNRTTLS